MPAFDNLTSRGPAPVRPIDKTLSAEDIELLYLIRDGGPDVHGDKARDCHERAARLKHTGMLEWHGGAIIGRWKLTPAAHKAMGEQVATTLGMSEAPPADPDTHTSAAKTHARLADITNRMSILIATWDLAWDALQACNTSTDLKRAQNAFDVVDNALTRMHREHSMALADSLAASRAETDAIAAELHTLMAGHAGWQP